MGMLGRRSILRIRQYTSAEMQNSKLQVMGMTILREMANCLQNTDFSVSWLRKRVAYPTMNSL